MERLRNGDTVKPELFDVVTIMFLYICGIEEHASSITATDITDTLNWIYSLFDEVLQKFDVYKVETVGEHYMVESSFRGSRRPF